MNEEATDVYVDECLKIYKLQRRKNETSRLGHRKQRRRSAARKSRTLGRTAAAITHQERWHHIFSIPNMNYVPLPGTNIQNRSVLIFFTLNIDYVLLCNIHIL